MKNHWHRVAGEFVSTKEHFLSQTIYDTNQDKRDVVYVTAIFIQMRLIVHVVPQDLGQSPVAKDHGNYDELSWNLDLGVTTSGS